MLMKQVPVSELKELANEKISLRKPNEHKIEEYAERMRAGVVFPPVIVGQWPASEKYGAFGIVDGIHRVGAALKAGVKSLSVEERAFPSLEEALSFMYIANMAHGLPVTEGQRNARIKLLRQIDAKMSIDKLAEIFGLSRSSCDRILKDEQGEGKSGPKGANKSKAHKSQEPLKAKAFFNALERICETCESKIAVADILAFAQPETDKGPKVDKEMLQSLKATIANLTAMAKELN